MVSVGAGLGLLVLAIYLVFLTESGWCRVIGGLYIVLFFVLSIIDAFQSPEPALHLVIPGLIAFLIYFAYTLRNKSKGWP
jgi:hypothetical protein